MTNRPSWCWDDVPGLTADVRAQVTRNTRQPPPMREVTKGWATMREESKTVDELRAADNAGR